VQPPLLLQRAQVQEQGRGARAQAEAGGVQVQQSAQGVGGEVQGGDRRGDLYCGLYRGNPIGRRRLFILVLFYFDFITVIYLFITDEVERRGLGYGDDYLFNLDNWARSVGNLIPLNNNHFYCLCYNFILSYHYVS
jgi:hypothetical protein